MKKYSDNAISSLSDDWGLDPKDNNLPFSGQAVQDFIKNQLGEKVGHAIVDTDPTDDKTYLYCFNTFDDYDAWKDDKTGKEDLILFQCELPSGGGGSQTLDVYSVSIERPDDQDLEIITTNSNVYLKIRVNSKVKRAGASSTVQLKETGTLTISTASGTSNAFTKKRSMSLSSIDNEDATNNYTTVDVSSYVEADKTTKIRFAWKGSESQLTRTVTFVVDQSTFGLSFKTAYEYPFNNANDITLSFGTTGSISKTLYVNIPNAGYIPNEDSLNVGTQTYTHKSATELSGDIEESINIGKLANGVYTGTYWICTDSIKSEVKEFQFLVSDEESGIEMVINNTNNSISNWAKNDIFDYAFCGASTSNLKFVFWNSTFTEKYGEVSQSNVTQKTIHTLSLQTEFNITEQVQSVNSYVRAYLDDGRAITSGTTAIAQKLIVVDTSENFAPTSMASGFILDPKSRSNSGSDKEVIYNALNNRTVGTCTWTHMDWLNGGWTSDDDGNKCLRMLAGSKVAIPYKVFDSDTNHNTLRYGITIEVDFAFRNVSDDTVPVINMSKKSSRTEPYGLIMYPNVSYIYTKNLTDTLNQDTEYAEDKRTHFTMNVKYGHTLNVDGQNYSSNIIRTYINSTVNREFLYGNDDSFQVDTDTITIGSDYADVDIYGIRIYQDQTLETSQIQQDYISALPSFTDKQAYKAANNICNADGTINYELAKNRYRTIKFTGRYPYYRNKAASVGDLTVIYLKDKEHYGKNEYDEYGNLEIDEDNSCIITNMSCEGQGSTSKQYYKWNATWKFTNASDGDATTSVYKSINGSVINNHAYYQLVKRDEDDQIIAVTPRATKLVGKLNYASSMQSHKQGSLKMYEDLRNELKYKTEIQTIGGSDDPDDEYYKQRFDLSRLALYEDEFLFFVEENGVTKFYGLMTWGAGKGDKLTYGYDKNVEGSKDVLMVGGSTQTNPLTLVHSPWITSDVSVSTDSDGKIKTWTYKVKEGSEVKYNSAYDNELGNTKSIVYIRDYVNFIYVHSCRLKPYTGSNIETDNASLDKTYQYWTDDYEVYRYDYSNATWKTAGVQVQEYASKDYTDSETYAARLNLLIHLDGVKVAGTSNEEVTIGTTSLESYTKDELNTIFLRARAQHLRDNIGTYVNISEILFCFDFTLFIAASDNLAKNSYLMVDKKKAGAARPLIHPWRDDDDTIFRINNEGTKDKMYWVEYFTQKENGNPYFTANNSGYFGTLMYAYYTDFKERESTSAPSIRSVMNNMISSMASLGSGYEVNGDAVEGCFNRYYFSIQNYFPSVAYNETAKLLYEEAALLKNAGIEVLDSSKNEEPITMSMGDSLQGEMQFIKMRTFFMKTFAMYYDGLKKFGFKLDDKQNTETDKQVTVKAGAHMYAFSMQTEKQTKQAYPIYLEPNQETTFTLDVGQTVTATVVGTDYLSSVGDWSNKKTYDGKSSISLMSNRTTVFKGGDAVAANVKFDPKELNDSSFPVVIEEINLKNVSNLVGTANMTKYKRLRKLYLDGTNIINLQLPMTNSLTNVTVPNTLESITIRQAPNFVESALAIENMPKLTTINIYSDGNAEHDYYGTHFSWISTWLNNLNGNIVPKTECRLTMEGINWTLSLEECDQLAALKNNLNTLDLQGTITFSEFNADAVARIKAAFGDDAFNPSNKLVFSLGNFTYAEVIYNTTSKDGGVTSSKLTNETRTGLDVVQGWSNDYLLYLVNYDIVEATWSIDNANATLSNQSVSGVTVTCASGITADASANLKVTFKYNVTNPDTGAVTVATHAQIIKALTLKTFTYPKADETSIVGDELLNVFHSTYDFNLRFTKSYYTGTYSVAWSIGKYVNNVWRDGEADATIYSSTNAGCKLYTTANSEQATVAVLRAEITYNNAASTKVMVETRVSIGQKLMGQFGDILLSNGSFKRPIFTYNESGICSDVSVTFGEGETPIGVCVVPRTHMKDKSARIMSLVEMNCSTPDTGSLSRQGITWGGYQTNLSNLDEITRTASYGGSGKKNDWARLGSETNYNGNFKYLNSASTVGITYPVVSGTTKTPATGLITEDMVDNLWYYYDPATQNEPDITRMHPSPFVGDGPFSGDTSVQNFEFTLSGTTIASSDFNGKSNTEKILNNATAQANWKTDSGITNQTSTDRAQSLGFHPAACCCWRFHTPGTSQGEWYLPAAGELAYIIPRFAVINKILAAIGIGKALSLGTGNGYWSSSEYSSFYAWYVDTYYGRVGYYNKYYGLCVRAFLAV